MKLKEILEGSRYGYDDFGYSLAPGHDEGPPIRSKKAYSSSYGTESNFNLKNTETGNLLTKEGKPSVFSSRRHAEAVARKLKFGTWEPVHAKNLDEMVPGVNNAPQPAKVQKINPDGTADVVDTKGTVTKVNQKDIAPDSNDPNKLNVNVPKPQLKPGTNVTMTSEELGYDEVDGKSAASEAALYNELEDLANESSEILTIRKLAGL